MQVSIESSEGLERHLKIQLPAESVDHKVAERLEEATKTVVLKGFRKGKVPLRVVKQQFGQRVRGEIVGELINTSLREAIESKSLRPVGQPRIEGLVDQKGAPLEYVAIFEVYPEIEPAGFSGITLRRPLSDVAATDIDTMIETLRSRDSVYETVDRAAQDGDQVTMDYVGTKEGVAFAGGTATDQTLVLGSNSMIPGFEEGLLNVSQGDSVLLPLGFPDDYHAEELKGAAVEFSVTVKAVAEKIEPPLDDEFFERFGVSEGGLEKFREEVERNLQRELNTALRTKIKNRVMQQLFEHNPVELPDQLIANETEQLKRQMIQQFGRGQDIDLSMLPDEMFRGKAQYRAALSVIVTEVVQRRGLTPDAAAVKARIDEISSTYDEPQQVVDYYYANQEMLASVEAVVLEDLVVEAVLAEAVVEEEELAYEDAVKPDPDPDFSSPEHN